PLTSVLTVVSNFPPFFVSIRMSAPSIGCPLASLTIPSSTELAAHALATKSINPTKPIRSDFSMSINNIPFTCLSLWTCFPFIVLGLFDFSLLRTHFCLITEYSVEFRAALRGNLGDCGPKCESRGLRARYRLGLSRKPVTATCATSFLRHRQRQYQRHTFRHGACDDDLQFGRANEMMVSFAR